MMGATFLAADYQKIFVDNTHLLAQEDFEHVVKLSAQTKRPLEQMLMERAFVAPHQLLQLLSEYTSLPSTELRVQDVDRKTLKLMPYQQAETLLAIPFAKDNQTIKVAVANPLDQASLDSIATYLQDTITYYVATERAIRNALILYDKDVSTVVSEMLSGAANKSSETVPHLVDALIETAILLDASDIHIEPFEDEILVRMRVDGLLRQVAILPAQLSNPLVAQLKIRARLRIDERRLPQDGRFVMRIKGQEVNLRLSTVPSLWGEKVVMRVLPKEAHLFSLTNMGLLNSDLRIVQEHLKLPFGTILACGPTGSGKTTTLYACLQEISNDHIDIVNISTIEDPIEYTVPRVNQIQTNPEIGLTFAAGLRALLRQDPDILMVGEIRDSETADFAVRASLVGRLVVSSLHTNDAIGAIPRLLDMGVEPYLIASTLSLVIAQRLARKLCLHCRQSHTPDAEELKDLKQYRDLDKAFAILEDIGILGKDATTKQIRFFISTGCEHCGHTGYSGRTGLFELLEINEPIKQAINARADISKLRQIALDNGMKTMFTDGLAKVSLGLIDIKELLRVVYA